jgi:hypothetical protein
MVPVGNVNGLLFGSPIDPDPPLIKKLDPNPYVMKYECGFATLVHSDGFVKLQYMDNHKII